MNEILKTPAGDGDQAEAIAELLRLQSNRAASSAQVRREMARGLRYTHFRANANTNQLIQVLSTVEAATALLEEKGLLQRKILEKRKAELAETMRRDFASKGLGVQLEQSKISKYDVRDGPRIDCESRMPLCKAACCKMHFALSAEDLEEGKIRWDVGQPYVIAQGDDGWCVHLDRQTGCCGSYEARPSTCRTYDCRGDARIWLDFEKRIINPQINDASWPRKTAAEPAVKPAATAHSAEPVPASRVRALFDVLPAHPDVWNWGEHFVSSYGLFLSLGFAIAAAVWLFHAGSIVGAGWGPLFLPGVVLASYAGSRLLRIAEAWLEGLFRNQKRGFAGHALYGGLAAGIGFSALWWRGNPNAWWMVDRAAPAIALGLAIAKLGCLGSGCCIGCPTARGPALFYSHPLSKAVAYYGASGIPLAPLQIYESLFGFAAGAAFLFLPANWFGSGRVLGLFLVVLSAVRTILLPFRYRLPGVQASALITGIVHLVFVTVGTGLMLAGPSTTQPALTGRVIAPWALSGSVASVAILILLLFGVHRRPAPGQASV